MKKISSALLTGAILLCAISNLAGAQDIAITPEKNKVFNRSESPGAGIEGNIRLNELSARAARNFEKKFRNAQNVTWYKVASGFMAYFYQNERKVVAGYDSKGHWLYYRMSYSENQLPIHVRKQIRRNYDNFSITWATEIQTGIGTIYIVNIENNDSCQIIRVCDDEMDVIGGITKP